MLEGDFCAGCDTVLDRTEAPVIDDGKPHHNHLCVQARMMREPQEQQAA